MSKKVGLFLCPKGGGYANGIQNATLAKIDEAGEKLQNIGSSVENKKGISLESKRKRHPGKGRKNHHGIGRCFDARLDMPKAIAKGDDICALRHIKSDDKQGDQ